MRVERLSRDNHDAVRRLILDGLAERWGQLDPSANPDLDDMFDSYPGAHGVVVRDSNGRVVGTGLLVRRAESAAEIVRMSVAADVRRQGVGRIVVDELVAAALALGADRIVLETTSTWTDAVAFYLRCGFEITHTADGEFGEDAWFEMRLGS